MFDFSGLQIFEIGIVMLSLILVYVFRDHIVDIAEILAEHKKVVGVVFLFVVISVVIMLNPTPVKIIGSRSNAYVHSPSILSNFTNRTNATSENDSISRYEVPSNWPLYNAVYGRT